MVSQVLSDEDDDGDDRHPRGITCLTCKFPKASGTLIKVSLQILLFYPYILNIHVILCKFCPFIYKVEHM